LRKHNAGLSDKQKKRWVSIANSVLEKCMADGGSEETCAASAIRQANGVAKTNEAEYSVYSTKSMPYTIKTKIHQGRKHIIVPVVMMVEGVHNGSHGPLLHLAEDLGRFPASWDGIPVTINHPNVDGINVSATSPDIIETQCVGRVYNTQMEEKKLKAEIWLDALKLTAVSPVALAYILEGKPLDVSVGVFNEEERVSGTYMYDNAEEKQYDAIARNHRPNHVALLPGETGACGWKDGCGVRVNKEGDEDTEDNVGVTGMEVIGLNVNEMKEEEILTMQQLAGKGYFTSLTNNKQGYQDLMSKIQDKLSAMENRDGWYALEELYDANFIYRKRGGADSQGDTVFCQQNYSVNEDGSVEFTGEPLQVRKEVSYIQVNTKMIRTNFSNKSKGDKSMADEVKPCCLEKVVELIDNKLTRFTIADKDWLMGLDKERLDQLTPKELEVIAVNKVVETPPIDLTDYVKKSSLKTTEDFLAIAPAEMQDQLQSGLRLHQVYRAELVTNILTNSEEGAWTAEELKKQDTVMLEKLSKQFKAPVNYAAQNAGAGLRIDVEEKLLPVGVQ